MKKSLIAGLVAGLLLAACSPENHLENSIDQTLEANGIVGAEKYSTADLGFKATVALLKNGAAFCTGTLIDSRIVLTAAHCLNEEEPTNISIRFFDGTLISGLDFVMHSGYVANSTAEGMFSLRNIDSDDIALISLSKAAPATAKIASLPKAPLKVGKHKVRAFGIGLSSSKKSDSGNMRMVNLEGEVQKDREKKIIYDQRGGKGICKGDSGGPQFVYANGQPLVIALSTSVDKVAALWGRPVGDLCRATAVSTLTGHYLKWISESKKLLQASMNGVTPDCLSRKDFRQDMADNFTNVDFTQDIKMVGELRRDTSLDGRRVWVFDFVGTGKESRKAAGGTASFDSKCWFNYIDGFGE